MKPDEIGVLGAGTMGIGIAHAFAEYGYHIVVVDNQDTVLNNFDAALSQSYKTQCMLGKPQASFEEIRNRIKITKSLDQLKNCIFIVENTTEAIKLKCDLLVQLNKVVSTNCIIAINTSCIPITTLSQYIDNAQRMLGIHFMNPVPIKNFVEIIKTEVTSADTLTHVKNILKSIHKSGNVVKDNPGFVINRVFMVTINEAIKVLEERVCQDPAAIDELFTKCLGQKMGPLMTADLIGLDTILYSLNVLHHELKNDMYLPAHLLVDLVNQGKLGRKSGEGLYNYNMSFA